ncbi:MAG: hypothetical protein ABMA64_36345 [Myxococcota bacterium]
MTLAWWLGCTGNTPPPTEPEPCADPRGVTLGTGANAFAPLEPGGTLALVHGPQGGYHLPLAVRACATADQVQLHFTGQIDGAPVVDVRLEYPLIVEDACCSVALDVYGYLFADTGTTPLDLVGATIALEVELDDGAGVVTDAVELAIGSPVE